MFHYLNNVLYCEKVELSRLAEEVGTPCYVYSYEGIIENFTKVKKAFSALKPLIAYSVKANPHRAILTALALQGAGFDIVSGGELRRVSLAGGKASKIIFAGVGKTPEEINLALNKHILMFNIESLPEVRVLNEMARQAGKKADVAIRVNPDIQPKTHHYITTGRKEDKFGIKYDIVSQLARDIKELPHLNLCGLHSHIGSQILSIQPYIQALHRLRSLAKTLKEMGITIKVLNLGGGFGIDYKTGKKSFPMAKLAAQLIPIVKSMGCQLILEPGRYIIGPAGALLTQVLYIKKRNQKNFLIVDGAMNDLIRPCLYSAYHRIVPVQRGRRRQQKFDVVGPVCESSDFFALDRPMPLMIPGEYLCLLDAGAYGHTMASNYNSRPRPAEVMVKGNKFYLIRERETLRDIIKGEQLPPFLKK